MCKITGNGFFCTELPAIKKFGNFAIPNGEE